MDGMMRIDKKTPSGGDYSIMYYLDDDGNEVPKEKATNAIINEYKKNGDLINSTYGIIKKG